MWHQLWSCIEYKSSNKHVFQDLNVERGQALLPLHRYLFISIPFISPILTLVNKHCHSNSQHCNTPTKIGCHATPPMHLHHIHNHSSLNIYNCLILKLDCVCSGRSNQLTPAGECRIGFDE